MSNNEYVADELISDFTIRSSYTLEYNGSTSIVGFDRIITNDGAAIVNILK